MDEYPSAVIGVSFCNFSIINYVTFVCLSQPSYNDSFVQAGTVLSTLEANSAKDVGAKFLMSPITMQVLCQSG